MNSVSFDIWLLFCPRHQAREVAQVLGHVADAQALQVGSTGDHHLGEAAAKQAMAMAPWPGEIRKNWGLWDIAGLIFPMIFYHLSWGYKKTYIYMDLMVYSCYIYIFIMHECHGIYMMYDIYI